MGISHHVRIVRALVPCGLLVLTSCVVERGDANVGGGTAVKTGGANTGGAGGGGAYAGGAGGALGSATCKFSDIAGTWIGSLGTSTTSLQLTFEGFASEGEEIGTNVLVNQAGGGCIFSMRCAPDEDDKHIVFNELTDSTAPSTCEPTWYRLSLIDEGAALQVDSSQNEDGSGAVDTSVLTRE